MLSLKYQTRNEFKIFKHTASAETDKVDTGSQHYGSSTSTINASKHFVDLQIYSAYLCTYLRQIICNIPFTNVPRTHI